MVPNIYDPTSFSLYVHLLALRNQSPVDASELYAMSTMPYMPTKKTSCPEALCSEKGSDPARLSDHSAHQGLPAVSGETHVYWSIESDFPQTSRCRPEVGADL